MCAWKLASSGLQPTWLTWCVSCSALHSVMMTMVVPRPSLALGLLTTFLLSLILDVTSPSLSGSSTSFAVLWWTHNLLELNLEPTYFLAALLHPAIGYCGLYCILAGPVMRCWTRLPRWILFICFPFFGFNVTFVAAPSCWPFCGNAPALVWWRVGL